MTTPTGNETQDRDRVLIELRRDVKRRSGHIDTPKVLAGDGAKQAEALSRPAPAATILTVRRPLGKESSITLLDAEISLHRQHLVEAIRLRQKAEKMVCACQADLMIAEAIRDSAVKSTGTGRQHKEAVL